MAIDTSSTETGTADEEPLGPGRRLHAIRISRGLQIQDIASRLRLHVRTLEHLESDDYDALHAPTFVRGYLRGYARALEVPEAPFLEAFDELKHEPPPLVSDIAGRSEAKSTDFPVRVVTHAIAALLLVLVAIWWQSQRLDPGERTETGIASTKKSDSMTAPGNETILDEVAATSGAGASMVAQTAPAPPSASAASAQLINDAYASGADATLVASYAESVPGAIPLGSNEDAIGSPASVATSGAALSHVAVPPDESEVAALDPGAATGQTPLPGVPLGPTIGAEGASPTQSRLKLALESDSWVEVYDRENNKLYYALAKGGHTIDISGPAPFRVLLGYARGVSVEFNGEAFDHSGHMDRGVARFVLGGSSPPTENGGVRLPSNEIHGAIDLTRLLIPSGGVD